MTSLAQSPTLEEWRALYAAADRFYNLQPWTWLYEDQLVGVVNPEDDEVGYCSIMGNLGEHLALSVYLGTEGFFSFLTLQDAADGPDVVDAFIEQRALQISFEDRDRLTDEDRKILKKVGLKLRGRKAFPFFRDCTPGCYPWYLTAGQCRFLTLALDQVCDVAKRFQDVPDDLGSVEGDQFLARVHKTTKKGSTWIDEWRDFPEEFVVPGIEAVFAPADLATWQKQAAGKEHQGALELDYFYMPHPIQENPAERPLFPQQIIAVDHKSGFVFGSDIAMPTTLGETFIRLTTELLSKMPSWPRQIEVRRSELVALLAPLEKLGIAIVDAYGLPAFEDARESALSFLDDYLMGEELDDLEDEDVEE